MAHDTSKVKQWTHNFDQIACAKAIYHFYSDTSQFLSQIWLLSHIDTIYSPYGPTFRKCFMMMNVTLNLALINAS